MRRSSLERILLLELRWVTVRARRLASEFPGTQADDVVQEVVEDFFERAAGGWFDGAPTISDEARVRHLLGLCLLHSKSGLIRQQRRRGCFPGERSDDSGSDPIQAIPQPASEPRPDTGLLVGSIQQQIEALTPLRRLFILAIEFPHLVTRQHIDTARQYRSSGGQGLLRDTDEAYGLYMEALSSPERGQSKWWIDRLARIFRWDGPLEDLTGQDLARAKNSIEAHVSRARRALQARLGDGEVG